MQPLQHRLHHICGLIAPGEHPVPTLHLRRHARLFKKTDHILLVKCTQTAVQKGSVARDVAQDFLQISSIRNVAAPLARDAHLAPYVVHAFQEQHFRPIF